MQDLRRTDFYLTLEEQNNWDDNNILYNNIWFFINKQKMPDIEYSDAAISIFKSQDFYHSWNVMYHACGGKVILPPKEDTFNADIMTGWWNPCKYFIGLKSRTDITPEFLKEIPQKRDCLFDWVKDKNPDIKEKHFNSFISFLEIVYTAGNLIPAPLNWKAGRSLDGWDYKLDNILNQKDSQGEQWYQYIVNNYNSEKPFECFIEKNNLQMYYNSNKVISFWGENKPNSWSEATPEQWTTYFENATNCIIARNNILLNGRTLSTK
ncbi:hypothetical protein NQ504_09805 [Ligilactobacillus ruminis]|uniref:Uncharacterized protein n=1 Tax=Ligilactobacillus ruminis ATCC 25644 TaxID=525362 RepID=E7FTM2_9LACO|nr:hypothetical protein [Ligilactobacillus ruminis]EFZ33636.1 hypothetical protein HMPREF0542_12250 [Ligilactobacillus ruminis ATCC 25644]EGX98668.1 hypothetical protein ANHS_771 [Ligilactobacillus ruminis ATCC 25644]UWP39992.1 hypothetical protein NQ504_09805 [Ligilactobacillus ruminis]